MGTKADSKLHKLHVSMNVTALGICFHAALALFLCQQLISVTQVQAKCMQFESTKPLKIVLEANKSCECVFTNRYTGICVSQSLSMLPLASQCWQQAGQQPQLLGCKRRRARLQMLCHQQFPRFGRNSITETCLQFRLKSIYTGCLKLLRIHKLSCNSGCHSDCK